MQTLRRYRSRVRSTDAVVSDFLSSSDIVPTVVLYSPQRLAPEFKDQVHLSRGTCLAETFDSGSPPYVHDARIPNPDWRVATDEENAVLWSATPPQTHCGVGIARLLSPQLIKLFQYRNDIFTRPDDGDTLKHPLMRLLFEIIRKAGLTVRHARSARIGRDQRGLVTMTKAVDQDARIGLHFDRWDRLSVDEMEKSNNRVSINLGPSDRYFIFLNHTASGMAAILERANLRAARDVRVIGMTFMSAFPDYPIVRLRLRPGDAYIAPTENILHDGSSAEVTEVNHYLSILGRFDFMQA